jgi:hypothetical protein
MHGGYKIGRLGVLGPHRNLSRTTRNGILNTRLITFSITTDEITSFLNTYADWVDEKTITDCIKASKCIQIMKQT